MKLPKEKIVHFFVTFTLSKGIFFKHPWTSASKKYFVGYFEHFLLSLVCIAIFKTRLLDFTKFPQPTAFLHFNHTDYTRHFCYLFRGCLHMKCHPEMQLFLSMVKFPYYFQDFLSEWNFILGWTHPCQKDRDEMKFCNEHVSFFNFWCICWICFSSLSCTNII